MTLLEFSLHLTEELRRFVAEHPDIKATAWAEARQMPDGRLWLCLQMIETGEPVLVARIANEEWP